VQIEKKGEVKIVGEVLLMGCLHDLANVQQTSSKRPTNVQLHYNIWQQTSRKLPANVQQTSSSIITYGSKRPANFQQTSNKRPAPL